MIIRRNHAIIEAAPDGGGTPVRGLTRSSDYGREGLAMKATRSRGLEPATHAPQGLSIELKAIYDAWPERFRSKVELSASCWEWTGCKDAAGYGSFGLLGTKKTVKVHRYALELVGRKPRFGVAVDHLCRNPSCVRPDHLEEVGNRENTRRGRMSNDPSGWCRAGIHRWISENIYTEADGRRRCRPCRNAAQGERRSTCEACGQELLSKNLRRHRDRKHGVSA